MKKLCQLDDNGFFIEMVEADESPLEPGVYLIPRNAVEIDPPILSEGKRFRLESGKWVSYKINKPVKVKKNKVLDKIISLEDSSQITHRNIRELIISVAELSKNITDKKLNLPLVKNAKKLEKKIKKLRKKL